MEATKNQKIHKIPSQDPGEVGRSALRKLGGRPALRQGWWNSIIPFWGMIFVGDGMMRALSSHKHLSSPLQLHPCFQVEGKKVSNFSLGSPGIPFGPGVPWGPWVPLGFPEVTCDREGAERPSAKFKMYSKEAELHVTCNTDMPPI